MKRPLAYEVEASACANDAFMKNKYVRGLKVSQEEVWRGEG